jgi:chromosomal replication initiator protein
MDPWEQIKNYAAGKITSEAFQNWFAKTSLVAFDQGHLRVAVPDDATRQWMQEEYAGEVWSAIHDLGLSVHQISYQQAVEAPEHSSSGQPEELFASALNLNPNFTFESFVVGSCNQFAHAAAKAVATVPAKTYNPLFIYGGTGMGKTHLMHAIGRELQNRYGRMRVIYTSSERFMNEMINCIRLQRMQQFHRHYRSADVLLVDDIQTLGGAQRTQEEFFHTFNELYEHQKQIVLSSDTPPKNTPGLVERLRSRFEWGLMVDVQPPDLETKMAILDKKAGDMGIRLPEEVRIFIATRTKTSVRELEGALVKLVAYASVTAMPITLAMAQQNLKHLTLIQERKVTIESIIKAVAEHFSLQPAQLKQKGNTQNIVYPRQIAMYLAKELTSASLPEMGRAFGGKHHTTVLHSIQKIEDLRHKNPDLNSLLNKLSDSLH